MVPHNRRICRWNQSGAAGRTAERSQAHSCPGNGPAARMTSPKRSFGLDYGLRGFCWPYGSQVIVWSLDQKALFHKNATLWWLTARPVSSKVAAVTLS